MENPYANPIPENIIDRAHAFARILAYGVANGDWDVMFEIHRNMIRPKDDRFDAFATHVVKQWQYDTPSAYFMESFGYFQHKERNEFILTERAFSLLERPSTAPNTFISYRGGYSTAFALYLESRLRLAGNTAVFVDRALEPGSEWRSELETKIQQSQYLIVLCTHGTFDSQWVAREIYLANESGCTIVPILHPSGRDAFENDHLPSRLQSLQTIKVQGHTAAEYEVAANKLLSYMGYSTY